MKKNIWDLLSVVFIALCIYWIFYSVMPQSFSKKDVPLTQFSTQRAFNQDAFISQKPHFVGSKNHEAVADYLQDQLQKLGLQTEIQEGYIFYGEGMLVKAKNILARIKGSGKGKALLLLSHYDSAPHSASFGAADDGSGVATILEGLRAFLAKKTAHKNDIIVLFSDAEELDLNGAALFVTQHKWAKDIGLVLNFEARGTSGPSYMFMETNQGNAGLLNGFVSAKPQYPVSNSLVYSIYKLLPNDTDLTVFRETADIPGLNFAFIGSDFNYHSQQDDLQHLSPLSLAQQGSYLMALLPYFSNADLSRLTSTENDIYFNTPVNFIHYPFSWNPILLIIAAVLFVVLITIGIRNKTLMPKAIGKGFLLFVAALILTGLLTFFGWKLILKIYPQYNAIIQGFTYNGNAYICLFVFLTLAVCFFCYRKISSEKQTISFAVAPLFFWLLINIGLLLYLPGGSFFIIPVYFGLIMLGYFVFFGETNRMLFLLLCVPAFVIFSPFISSLTIGLGMNLLTGSALLTALLFTLLLPVFGLFSNKIYWSVFMLFLSVVFFVYADHNAGFEKGKARQNSLDYILDADAGKALWATYDRNLDGWTGVYLGSNPQKATSLEAFSSRFTYIHAAPAKKIAAPTIRFLQDPVSGNKRIIKIDILPNRNVNRYDIFADKNLIFNNLTANGVQKADQKSDVYQRYGNRLLTYFVVNNEPLKLQFWVDVNAPFGLTLFESSFDLTTNRQFNLVKRPSLMMPTPFVLNDAVIISKKIQLPQRQ